jgi:hypothetical protein
MAPGELRFEGFPSALQLGGQSLARARDLGLERGSAGQ